MPIFQNYYVLTSYIDKKHKELVVMTYINEEEEQKIDEGEKVTINRGDKTFIVHHNNIYCYGEVDFRKGSEDCEEIANFSFLNFLGSKGVVIPSDYDYERHECHSPIKYYRWSETWRSDVLARYAHACLNKPKRIVLFKRVV